MRIANETIIEAFNYRYACKKFDTNREVSPEDFATILEAGRLSPSSFGFEPWKFVVVEKHAKLRDKLSPVAWGAHRSLEGASHLVILLARTKADMIYNSDYITKMMTEIHHLPSEAAEGMRKAFENFQMEQFELLESDRAMFDWASKQTYIALGNMLTAAALLGIDSCPIEGFHRQGVEDVLKQEGILDTAHFGVSVMAGFGYRAEEPRPKTRQKLDDIVQWVN